LPTRLATSRRLARPRPGCIPHLWDTGAIHVLPAWELSLPARAACLIVFEFIELHPFSAFEVLFAGQVRS